MFRIFSIFLSQKEKERKEIDRLIDNLKFRGEKDHCTDYYYRKGCRIERKIIFILFALLLYKHFLKLQVSFKFIKRDIKLEENKIYYTRFYINTFLNSPSNPE